MFTEEDMEKEVYVSKDAEGNDFSKLVDCTDQICIKEEGGYVEIYNTDEEEEFDGREKEEVIVLWRA